MYIISPAVKEADMRPAADQIQKMVTTNGGKIVEETEWGKKKLAYPIKTHRHGFYYLLSFDLEPAKVKALDESLKQNDDLLRHLLLKLEDHVVRAIAEQKKRAAAEEAEEAKTTMAKTPSAVPVLTPEKLKPAAPVSPAPVEPETAKPLPKPVTETKKESAAITEEKKEKAKLDELDKKLDEILDEDITD
jgi:small subunit ribosomal protein S6